MYGGTKEEMARLIKDASRMTDVQKKLGITVDESSMSFGNVVNAINVMQESMGIAGTTAKEASTTIEGSMNSAKAAWDNFLAGTGTAEEFAEAFSTAAEVVGQNLGQIVPRLVETVPAAAQGMYDGLVAAIESQNLASIGQDILSDLVNGIQTNAPKAIESGATVLSNFLSGIGQKLPELVPKGVEMIASLANAVVSNLPTILDAGIQCLAGFVQGIINSLPTLIAEGPRIINDFSDAIWGAVGKIITTGAKLIVELAKGLIQSLPTIKENAGEILMAIVNVMSLKTMVSVGKSLMTSMSKGIKGMLSSIKTAGQNILQNLVNGIKALAKNPVSTLKSIGTNAMNAFKNLSWSGVGKAIIQGIVNGLKAGVSSIVSAAKTVAKNALSAAKNALGIKSPSRVFRDEVGKMMAEGMGIGFEDNVPTNEMMDSISKSVKQMQKKAGAITKTVMVNASNKFNEKYVLNESDADNADPEDSMLHITNIFNVDGKPLVKETTKATIKKINSTKKDTDKWKGVK